jgi:hypothetical protein
MIKFLWFEEYGVKIDINLLSFHTMLPEIFVRQNILLQVGQLCTAASK